MPKKRTHSLPCPSYDRLRSPAIGHTATRRGRGFNECGAWAMWTMIGVAAAGYLLLLARSAWMQGEMRQFLRSLAIVAALCALVAGAVLVAMLLDSR